MHGTRSILKIVGKSQFRVQVEKEGDKQTVSPYEVVGDGFESSTQSQSKNIMPRTKSVNVDGRIPSSGRSDDSSSASSDPSSDRPDGSLRDKKKGNPEMERRHRNAESGTVTARV